MKLGYTRREGFKAVAGAGAFLVLGGTRAPAAAPSVLPPLPNLPESDVLLLTPADRRYEAYETAHNKRTMLRPALRAMCRTPRGVAGMVDWVRSNSLPFALRCGGHSYEGFSQSEGVVIDTRLMSGVAVDPGSRSVTVGAGASLGAIYATVGRRGLGLAAGTCPTVGVSGHTLGGGYGLLARPFGLTCDNLLSVSLVDATGTEVSADAGHNPDLFWACRGGGGGSFGVATGYRFRIFPLPRVVTFKASWIVPIERAVALHAAWQAWAPAAPKSITAVLNLSRRSAKTLAVHCAGQSVGPPSEVSSALKALTRVAAPQAPPRVKSGTFLDAVRYFSGGSSYPSVYMKAKSDFIVSPISTAGIEALMNSLLAAPIGAVTVLCDAYGGAIADVAAEDTAFPRRAGTLYSMQYYASWASPEQTEEREAAVKSVYDAMRHYGSGAAYVNYCDLQLSNWAETYWGQNLPRLRQIKRSLDPNNLFRHAQSVPLT